MSDQWQPVDPAQPDAGTPNPAAEPVQPFEPVQPAQPVQPFGAEQPYQPTMPITAGATEVLASSPPTVSRGGRGRGVAIVASAAAAVLVIGGGAYAWTALRDPGTGIAQHLPAGTAVVLSVDLNPSAGQKVDALRFAAKVPAAREAFASGDLRQAAYELLSDGVEHAPSWAEVKPWFGDEAALAAVPAPEDAATAVPLLVLQVTDEAKAAATLNKYREAGDGMAIGDGWAYLTDSDAHAQAMLAAARSAPLSDNDVYVDDIDALGDPGVATAWVDVVRTAKIRSSIDPSLGLPGATSALGSGAALTGHGAFALRFEGAALEVFGGFHGGTPAITLPAGTGVEALPSDSVLAVGAAGAGPAFAQQWPTISQSVSAATGGEDGLDQLEQSTGLQFPDDLEALLGKRFALALGSGASGGQGIPSAGVRVDSSAAGLDRALTTVMSLAEQGGIPLQRRMLSGGYVLATTAQEADALSKGGDLGRSSRFTAVAPDAAKASFVVYADLAGLAKELGGSMGESATATMQEFDAVGLTVRSIGKGDVEVRLRLTMET